uniref:Uncharacterized protein n=1 Tax=Arundo donax TaxID=35708 RepID=A0A0A8XQT0_ARUDO
MFGLYYSTRDVDSSHFVNIFWLYIKGSPCIRSECHVLVFCQLLCTMHMYFLLCFSLMLNCPSV